MLTAEQHNQLTNRIITDNLSINEIEHLFKLIEERNMSNINVKVKRTENEKALDNKKLQQYKHKYNKLINKSDSNELYKLMLNVTDWYNSFLDPQPDETEFFEMITDD